jgi:hypothetical protein
MQECTQLANATEAITLFTPGTTTGVVSTTRQRVQELAGELGLSGPQLSAVHGTMTWAVFLRPSTPQRDRETLRSYLDVMGYLPADRKVVASAERSRDVIDEALPQLLDEITHRPFNPETFPDFGDLKTY